jgi:hypothetical protein
MGRSQALRNVAVSLAVYLVAFGLYLASPDPSVKDAHLMCGAKGSVAVFLTMNACALDPRFKTGECSCFRPPSEWSRLYSVVLVPVIAMVLGYLGLRGTLTKRLLLLNGAFAAALISVMVEALIVEPDAAMVLPQFPVILFELCAGLTIGFLVVSATHRAIIRRSSAPAA